ncbi:NAD(P)H-dependent flavin oxidoreductase [Sphingomonas sp. CCH18-H6]|uniref:NAD(P)H-dependent flavin oxidoreductase n=1 Tax=Sphingomonas sp. CCH18-H6 TaxID=1768787 RepID=UPI00083110F0|nr:nitronate monooxygenase [Sphingomonas sp. CCH18-H6]
MTLGLRLPVVAAPMFRVSGPELVVAACSAGVLGSFPTANCRDPDELDEWLSRIGRELDGSPYAVNLIVHATNTRLGADLEQVVRHRVPVVITSVGAPSHVVPAVRSYGGRVLADVASLRHLEKATATGVDGLVLLCSGAGGQTGWANPLAFVRAARERFGGTLVLAGGISDGHAVLAARAAGADLAYVGTRFIAAEESMAASGYRDMLVSSTLDDVITTAAMTGLPTNILRPSLLACGIDPSALEGPKKVDTTASFGGGASAPRRWTEIWSAGHGVGGVREVGPVRAIVDQLEAEYRAAFRALNSAVGGNSAKWF